MLTIRKDQLRDIASIGLKTVIAEIPGGTLASLTSTIITTKMLEGIAKKVRVSWLVQGCVGCTGVGGLRSKGADVDGVERYECAWQPD